MKRATVVEFEDRVHEYLASVRLGETVVIWGQHGPVAWVHPAGGIAEEFASDLPSLAPEEAFGGERIVLAEGANLLALLQEDRDSR